MEHKKPSIDDFPIEQLSQLHDSQRYRDCTINGISGIWEAEDVYELLKGSGHNVLCRRPWYSPVVKCVGDFQFLKHQRHYTTKNSKDRSDTAALLDNFSSSPILLTSVMGSMAFILFHAFAKAAFK